MSGIVVKYSRLNKSAKQELTDFIDFLLSKQKTDDTDFLTTYKNNILDVSVWSASDLKTFEENRKLFNQWSVQKW